MLDQGDQSHRYDDVIVKDEDEDELLWKGGNFKLANKNSESDVLSYDGDDDLLDEIIRSKSSKSFKSVDRTDANGDRADISSQQSGESRQDETDTQSTKSSPFSGQKFRTLTDKSDSYELKVSGKKKGPSKNEENSPSPSVEENDSFDLLTDDDGLQEEASGERDSSNSSSKASRKQNSFEQRNEEQEPNHGETFDHQKTEIDIQATVELQRSLYNSEYTNFMKTFSNPTLGTIGSFNSTDKPHTPPYTSSYTPGEIYSLTTNSLVSTLPASSLPGRPVVKKAETKPSSPPWASSRSIQSQSGSKKSSKPIPSRPGSRQSSKPSPSQRPASKQRSLPNQRPLSQQKSTPKQSPPSRQTSYSNQRPASNQRPSSRSKYVDLYKQGLAKQKAKKPNKPLSRNAVPRPNSVQRPRSRQGSVPRPTSSRSNSSARYSERSASPRFLELYEKGKAKQINLEKQRKEEVAVKNALAPRPVSVSRRRSTSTPRAFEELHEKKLVKKDSAENSISHSFSGNSSNPDTHDRLYQLSQKQQEEGRMRREEISSSTSTRMRSSSRQRAFEEIYEKKIEKRDSSEGSTSHPDTHDRLYQLSQKQQQEGRMRREEISFSTSTIVRPPSRQRAFEEIYEKKLQSRDSSESSISHSYSGNGSGSDTHGRLYRLSQQKQEEGRVRREEITNSRTRAPVDLHRRPDSAQRPVMKEFKPRRSSTPKTISALQATRLYDQGMKKIYNLEVQRMHASERRGSGYKSPLVR